MRDGEDFISLFSYRNELEKYVLHMKLKKVKKNCKAIVNHVGLGITIDLVRPVDHVFVESLGMVPQFLCGMLRLTPQTYHQT